MHPHWHGAVNHRGGWALVKATWTSWMQHRGFFFLVAFSWMIPLLVYLFVWSAAASEGALGGLTQGELAGYYLVLILVNQLTFCTTNWTVGDAIRYGHMNVLLLRPLSPVYDALASELAGKVVFMTFAIPLVAVLALFLRPDLHVTWQNALAFVPALALAWALRFLWGYWLALLAFWSARADALLSLQESLIFLIGGQVAPAALLPNLLQTAAVVLPFRYMAAFPAEILAGQLDRTQLWTGFAFQTGWLLVALVLFVVIWRAGLRRYSAVGG
jgi:ABC-2 type transport system permease protein